jgi:hypothetical protein
MFLVMFFHSVSLFACKDLLDCPRICTVQYILIRRPVRYRIRTARHLCGFYWPLGVTHKVLTYVEYRAVSGVFQNIDPPTPLSTQRVLPPHQRPGGTHSPGGEGGGGLNILEDARHRMASYSIIPLRGYPNLQPHPTLSSFSILVSD